MTQFERTAQRYAVLIVGLTAGEYKVTAEGFPAAVSPAGGPRGIPGRFLP